ncbi:MAG: hypothetical protein NTV46_06500 [Verrucomicrobia bacterium]|nr:hypothetical protein [Verrucomicrobiota bacterium]
MKFPFLVIPLCAVLAVTGCAPTARPPEEGAQRAAAVHLKEAAAQSLTAEQRSVLYLDSAKEASALLGSHSTGESARLIYNKAAADLTVLLCSAENSHLWNRPLTLNHAGTTYQLRFAKATRDGIWDPGYFTGMTQAETIPNGDLDRRNLRSGVGGALVGNHKPIPLPPHVRPCGINAAVTATLEFKGREVLLTLADPSVRKAARVAGAERPLAADFSAPLAAYPQGSELWNGLMGVLHVEQTMKYPTGNPPAYSALRLRQELTSIERSYPHSRPYVLIGHSMGGLLSRMQVTTVTRESWNVIGKDKAEQFFAKVKSGDIVDQATRFQANPHVGRVIFICTPHRGSSMAVGTIGNFFAKLISLPQSLTSVLTQSVGASIAVVTGDPKRMPNSVSGLSPNNPTLKVLDHTPMKVPYHSIIGDRGKGDSPNSSDGVVAYASSHLKGAKSERIVPGPHGACELPETHAEIRRILHQYIQQN